MIFGYIFINRIQPFEAANILALFLFVQTNVKINFEDDILYSKRCAVCFVHFKMYSI